MKVLALATLLVTMAASPKVSFDLPGGDATQTLTEWGRQAHVQTLFDYNTINGNVTRPVKGRYTLEQSLRILTAGTAIHYDFVNDHTVAFLLIIYCRPDMGAAAPVPPCEPPPLEPP